MTPTPTPLLMEFKKKRLELGITQAAVARYIGVTPQSVSQWESGVCTPSLAHLEKYWDMLQEQRE